MAVRRVRRHDLLDGAHGAAVRLRHLEDDRRHPRIPDAPGVSWRRRAVRDDRRSLRPPDRSHQQRVDLLAVHRGVRACAKRLAAGRLPVRPRARHGRRLDDRRGAGLRDVAGSAIAARPSGSCRAPRAVATGQPLPLAAVVLPRYGWRAMFFIGALPALAAFWMHGSLDESAMWTDARATPSASLRPDLFPRLSAGHVRARGLELLHLIRVLGVQLWCPRI